MARDFYGHRTVTDFLISKGVKFHPQTVVIEADFGGLISPDAVLGITPSEQRTRPIFDYQAIEVIFQDKQEKRATLYYVVWNSETLQAHICVFHIGAHDVRLGIKNLILQYDKEGYVPHDEKAFGWFPLDLEQFKPLLFEELYGADLPISAYLYALNVFSFIHEGYEVEAVEFPRQARRATERKTGKKPSNYYSLRNIKKTRKQYPASNSTGVKHTKHEAHLVRGHFLTHPDSHPLPQFAGKTFWVSAHQRGAGTNGKQVIYRVEL